MFFSLQSTLSGQIPRTWTNTVCSENVTLQDKKQMELLRITEGQANCPPAFKSLFSLHLGCGYARRQKQTNKTTNRGF